MNITTAIFAALIYMAPTLYILGMLIICYYAATGRKDKSAKAS